MVIQPSFDKRCKTSRNVVLVTPILSASNVQQVILNLLQLSRSKLILLNIAQQHLQGPLLSLSFNYVACLLLFFIIPQPLLGVTSPLLISSQHRQTNMIILIFHF